MRLYTHQEITAVPAARLIPGEDGLPPFAVVDLGGGNSLTLATRAEARALRDAAQRAGDLLAGAEGAAP